MGPAKSFIKKFARRCEGAAAIEFALVLSFLMVIVMGAMDFGHAWYMKQTITNAAREGARYGVALRKDGTRPTASDIQTFVTNDLTKLPQDANPQITFPNGISGNVGAALTVRVSANKTWWFIGNFIPGLGQSLQLGAETTMRVE